MKGIVISHEDGGTYVMDHHGSFHFVKGHRNSNIGDEININSAGGYVLYKRMAAAVACLFIAISISGYAWMWNTVDYYVSIDINPSIELSINKLGSIKDCVGINDDGISLIDGLSISGNGNEAIIAILQAAEENGYMLFDDSGSPCVQIMVAGNGEKALSAMDGLQQSIEQAEIPLTISFENCSLGYREDAKKLGITAGLYSLCQKVLLIDKSTPLDELRERSVNYLSHMLIDSQNQPDAAIPAYSADNGMPAADKSASASASGKLNISENYIASNEVDEREPFIPRASSAPNNIISIKEAEPKHSPAPINEPALEYVRPAEASTADTISPPEPSPDAAIAAPIEVASLAPLEALPVETITGYNNNSAEVSTLPQETGGNTENVPKDQSNNSGKDDTQSNTDNNNTNNNGNENNNGSNNNGGNNNGGNNNGGNDDGSYDDDNDDDNNDDDNDDNEPDDEAEKAAEKAVRELLSNASSDMKKSDNSQKTAGRAVDAALRELSAAEKAAEKANHKSVDDTEEAAQNALTLANEALAEAEAARQYADSAMQYALSAKDIADKSTSQTTKSLAESALEAAISAEEFADAAYAYYEEALSIYEQVRLIADNTKIAMETADNENKNGDNENNNNGNNGNENGSNESDSNSEDGEPGNPSETGEGGTQDENNEQAEPNG